MTTKKAEGWAGAAKANRKREEITIPFVKFEKIGDTVEGTLQAVGSQEFKKGDNVTQVGRYTLVTDDEKMLSFNGSKDLDEKLAQIEVGEYVWVTYVSDLKVPNGTMKQFKVERAVE